MAKEPVWTRAYLKNIGAQDNEIDYQNGAVTYKNKPFQYTTPGADGKAYGTQPELDSAYKSYQNNDAMEQLKASSANRMGEVNTALGQYKQNISKAPTPFTYDANSIKSDPLYTSGLQSLQNDAQTATNQSLVNLGRRGIGNSQSAVTSANAQQQNVVNQANTKLMPQVIAQKYQAYLDANAQQDKQNQNLLGYANSLSGLGQQEFNNSRQLGQDAAQATQQQFNNNLATNQDARAGQAQEFGQGVTKAGLTGYYGDASGVKQRMDANSAAWANASPEEQQRLHNENLQLAASIGSTYDPETGEYSASQGQRTMAGQAQDFTQGLQKRDQQLQETQVMSQLTGMLPDGTTTTAEQQRLLANEWKFAESQGILGEKLGGLYDLPADTPTQAAKAQAIQLAISQQNANTSSFSASNSAANSARSASNAEESQKLNRERFDWEKNPDNPDNIYKKAQADKAAAGPDAPKPTESSIKNAKNAQIVSLVDGMPPQARKEFFTNEKNNIITDLGIEGYERLYGMYSNSFKGLK